MQQFLAVCAILLSAPLLVSAGQYNPILDIGDDAPAWKDLPGVDGRTHSLADLKEKDVVVVVFTCNTCPYAVDHEDRLVALAKEYAAKGGALVAINVNKGDADRLPAMKERAEAKGFSFAYLHDESQQTANEYGATYTPEFFVLNKDRKIVYMGAMDDSPDGSNVTQRHVAAAIDAALAGTQPEVTETVAIGCGIRYDRRSRRR